MSTRTFIHHLYPPRIDSDTLHHRLSLGLGLMALVLLLFLFLTGLLQLLTYSPQIQHAYLSIQEMYRPGGLGGFIRNAHYFAGNLLVIVVFLHFLRVYLTTAYGGPRSSNWVVGLAMLVLVLAANFTGYLLPWDQLAFWAVTIFTSMLSYIPLVGEKMASLLRGGAEVGQQTLATFYAIHIGLLPLMLTTLLLYHLWLVRKAGGLIRKRHGADAQAGKLATVPHLVAREAALATLLLAALLLFSALVDAPLSGEANPGLSPNPAKAAWYFMGLQELLLHLHPSFAISVIPLLVLLFFLLLPRLKPDPRAEGVWFGGKKGCAAFLFGLLTGAVLIFFAILVDELLSARAGSRLPAWLGRGIFPTIGYISTMVAFFTLERRVGKCSGQEAKNGVVGFLIGSLACLTAVGIWLRGAEMALTWPSLAILP